MPTYILIGDMPNRELAMLVHQLASTRAHLDIVLVEHEPSRIEEAMAFKLPPMPEMDIAKVACDLGYQKPRPGYVSPRESFKRNGRKG